VSDDAEPRAPDEPGPDPDVESLKRALDRQQAIARREALRSQEELQDARASLRSTRKQLAGIERRRSVRLAVALADGSRATLQRLAGIGRRLDPRPIERHPVAPDDLEATASAVEHFLAGLDSGSDAGVPTSGPLVSIVMLNRDGASHLRRCLPAIASTAYRDIELIVVDNGSTDDSVAVVDSAGLPFPVRVIRNDHNASFSDGNNQALVDCAGDLVLFLNNDIEPIRPDWLGRMVQSILEPDVVAVGARLIYPRRTGDVRAGLRFPDLSLQHGGIDFRMVDGAPIPRPMGAGEDALSPWASAVREVPALTAACLLIRRATLDAIGGFTSGYDYGQEDVDLCLRLHELGGRLIYDGRAALWHHESATRELGERATRAARVAANRDRFVGTWAPWLYRTILLDAIAGRSYWRRDPLQVGFVPDPDGSTGPRSDWGAGVDADTLGWVIRPFEPGGSDEPSLDAIVVGDPALDVRLVPAGAVRIAWIQGAVDAWIAAPWFDEYDLVLVADERAVERLDRVSVHPADHLPTLSVRALAPVLERWIGAIRFGLRISVPSWDVAPSWGDYHVARGLQRALERAGHPTRVHLRPGWASWSAARDDVALHVLGLADGPIRPGQLNVLWQISHPDLADAALYERYDRVFVASRSFAEWMRTRVVVPVVPLNQATDPDRFEPTPGGPLHELLFVANSRGARRHILDDLLPTDRDVAVYGRGWTSERLEPRYLAGETVPNDQLARYYAAAKIVLNDHWPDMQREGFLSNRLYDASAAGAFVISDDIARLEEEFDGGVVSYRDRDDLRRLIDHYLDHPDERRQHAERARAAVLARHSFGARVDRLLAELGPLGAGRRTAAQPGLDSAADLTAEPDGRTGA
jgi:GT2 family glycosyltransferase